MQDNFFRFWFAFIYRNYGAIEIDPEMGKELVWKDINAYFGKAFENIAEELLVSLNRQNKLPFKFLEIGRWWDRGEEIDIIAFNKATGEAIGRWWDRGEEIDIIAFNKATGEALFCEVKWKDLTR